MKRGLELRPGEALRLGGSHRLLGGDVQRDPAEATIIGPKQVFPREPVGGSRKGIDHRLTGRRYGKRGAPYQVELSTDKVQHGRLRALA